MSKPIEDYAFIGNTITGALVARDGSIDWLCLPRFDSDACFAGLLGGDDQGYWKIAPADDAPAVTRRYRPGTAVLETCFETPTGKVTIVDFLPFTDDERYVDLVRLVRGDAGHVDLRLEVKIRFGYGRTVPWVRRQDCGISATAGPDAVQLLTPVELTGEDWSTIARFGVGAGDTVPFRLAYRPSHLSAREAPDCESELEETVGKWREWSDRCDFERDEDHPWRQAVTRSLITLKALTYGPTGGVLAAPTTSLPESLGGVRNWDYRFCWIRDATFALYSLLMSGYREEAYAWRRWLLRAAAGAPRQLQVLYGLDGRRRLTETELAWLPGYEGSEPVRIGNAASHQYQLDIGGELMDMLHAGRRFELEYDDASWELQKAILQELEDGWEQPDKGMWEVRGGRFHFTFSKMMCWVAFDRAIQAVEDFGFEGPVDRWRTIRERIREDVEAKGWNDEKQSFVQTYGGTALDASLLRMAELGFLAADDPRFRSTVEAIERELVVDGLVLRYRPEETPEGLPGGEGVFVAGGFWLADAYVLLGRYDDATEQFERVLALRNDVGLLAEEYDPDNDRQLGNFPQAVSHIALINTAKNLASVRGPAKHRAERGRGG